MYLVFSMLIVIVCFLLVLIVLVQNSKGGGLASGFSSSNQVMGVRRTTDFLEKATWTLAGALLVFCVLASVTIPRVEINKQESIIKDKVEEAADPNAIPSFPTSVPQEEQEQAPDAN